MTLSFYDGPSQLDGGPVVLLAGSVDKPSLNRKTGELVQLYILRADQPPWDAVRSGRDVSICGDCFHRAGPEKRRTCYVDLRFVTPVFFAKRRRGSALDLFGRDVRIGAYGDPVAIPFEVLESIARVVHSWVGYTEFWAKRFAQPYRSLLMASVHSSFDAAHAQELGWRTFRDRSEGEALEPGELECPHVTHGVQCIDCKLCDGARPADRRKNITIPFHGNARNEANRSSLRVLEEEA